MGGYSTGQPAAAIPPVYPITLPLNAAVPVGMGNSGTISAAGIVTFGTALPAIYGPAGAAPGIWWWFPGSAFATLPQGIYWCVMTSATVGQVYTATMTPPGSPLAPTGVLVPAVGSGSAYVGGTLIQPLVGVVIPAGAMGNDGSLRVTARLLYNNNVNSKTFTVFFGTPLFSIARSNVGTQDEWHVLISNSGSGLEQNASFISYLTSTAVYAQSTINTTLAENLLLELALNVATDFGIWESYLVEMFPG